MKEPSPMVKLTIGNDTKKTVAQQRTVDPKWEENFQFLIHDPGQQELSIEVLFLKYHVQQNNISYLQYHEII